MFDWPEQIQTSPTSTSSSVIVFLPLIVIVCGPPAGMRVERDLPRAIVAGLGALTLTVQRPTVTSSPGSAQPQTRSF